MTGTADTEAAEFHNTYKLDVVVIPTNKPIVRADSEDLVYKTEREKFTRRHQRDRRVPRARPAGAGRHDQRREERGAIARILDEEEHPAQRAQRQAPRERGVRRRAGRPQGRHHRRRPTWPVAAPTSSSAATRRCSRSSSSSRRDEALRADAERSRPSSRRSSRSYEAQLREREATRCSRPGGLHILGTERHESRRIDNQLRGRAGRQGDPGSVALLPVARRRPDAHLRRRPREEPDGAHGHARRRAHRAPVGHARASRTRRRKVEERNFDIRKNLLEYDDVMNAAAQDRLRAAPAGARAVSTASSRPRTSSSAASSPSRSSSRARRALRRAWSRPCSRTWSSCARRAAAGRRTRRPSSSRPGARRRSPSSSSDAQADRLRAARAGAVRQLRLQDRPARRSADDPAGCFEHLEARRAAVAHRAARAPARSGRRDRSARWSSRRARRTSTSRTGTRRASREGYQREFGIEATGVEKLGDQQRDRREALRRRRGGAQEARAGGRRADLPARVPQLLPAGDRQPVARAPAEHGTAARRHRPARLRPARSEEGVPEGGLRPVPRADAERSRRAWSRRCSTS